MDHALHGFGNAEGQTDRPVRYDGNIAALFQICGQVPVAKLQLKISSSSLFARGLSALRKVDGMSSGPGVPF